MERRIDRWVLVGILLICAVLATSAGVLYARYQAQQLIEPPGPDPVQISFAQVFSLLPPKTQQVSEELQLPTPIPQPTAADGKKTPTPAVPQPGPAVPIAEPEWPASYPVPWSLEARDHFYFLPPIENKLLGWPRAALRYGAATDTAGGVHTGIDLVVPSGTPVFAAAGGEVVWVGYGLIQQTEDLSDPYGLAVAVRHTFGYVGEQLYTIYAHLETAEVWPGQVVRAGQRLGAAGASGNATGAHLHFEVRLGENILSRTRNPELWLAPPEGWGVLAGRLESAHDYVLPDHKVQVISLQSGKVWEVRSYAVGNARSDDLLGENFLLSDLPAGTYLVAIGYLGERYSTQVQVNPGRITWLLFQGQAGFPGQVYDQQDE